MVRTLLFLLLTVFINNKLSAQHSTAVTNADSEKKSFSESTSPSNGFKKQSSVASSRKKVQAGTNPQIAKDRQGNNISEAEIASRVSAMVTTDYANMPAEVRSKVNSNKAHGANLLNGIVKGFKVEIAACVTDADRERILSFLKTKKGFIKSKFVSAGLVKIIVDPEFDSVDLKDDMDAEGIKFNFLNRFYLLKN